MNAEETYICPDCGGITTYYDTVHRIVRTKGRVTKLIAIPRLRCKKCKCTHRLLPPDIFPFKQYEAEVIRGVREGMITPDTKGFEDYPCEMTMTRWLSS